MPHRTATLLVEKLLERLRNGLTPALGRLERAETLLGICGSVGVLAQEDLLVLERVLLLHRCTLGAGLALGGVEDALDFGAVDETGKVGLGNNVGGDEEALLALVDSVKLLDGRGGPDDETTEVTTGCELEEIESIDGAGLDTGDVSEALDEILSIDLGAVDNEGTTSLAVTAASELALSGAELLGSLSLLNIRAGTDSLEQTKSDGRLNGRAESGRVDNEGNLGNGSDLVATGHQKGSDGRGSKSRGSSETPMRVG